MRSSYRLMLFLGGAFVMGVVAGNNFSLQDSFAQGYEGLIAPEATGADKQEPPGYRGLIPGQVPAEAQQGDIVLDDGGKDVPRHERFSTAPPIVSAEDRKNDNDKSRSRFMPPRERPRTAGMSTKKDYTPPRQARTIDDIQVAGSYAPKERVRWDEGVPPQLKDTLGKLLTPRMTDALRVPQMRMDGMLPEEYMAKQQVDQIMRFVHAPNQTDEQRAATAKKAADKLRAMAYSYEIKRDMPDEIFETMGLPENYRKEKKEAARNSLARVEAALTELRKYQK